MQPLTAPPRDSLSVDQVTTLLTVAPAVQVSRGLEVLDLSLNVIDDISGDFLDGTVTRDVTAVVHGACSLTLASDVDYGRQMLRPYLTLTADGLAARFNCGVYVVNKPTSSYGASVPSNKVAGSDRLSQLRRPVGDAYTASGDYLTAILDAFTAAGIDPSQVRVDGTAAGTTMPAAMVWPLLTDPNATNPLPVDATADTTNATTWLRVINALLAPINYRGVWMDWDGFFHCDPYIDPAVRPVEFTFDVDDPAKAIVARQRSRASDLSAVPNTWVFVQSNLVDGSGNPIQPTEGAGQYTVTNTDDGPTSINARGGTPIGERISVVTLDAANQATLEALGDKQVAADQAVAATFSLSTSPFPAAWHEDVYSYTDAEMGASSLKLLSTGWTLDFGSSTQAPVDMVHTLKQVA